MPNTLAHAGVQGLGSRTVLPNVDLKWVYLSCVIPDLPWIFQRAVRVIVPGIDPYLLRSYVIIQASLLGCLLFSGAVALVARRSGRVFALLGGNALLHLGLDAIQTKWGNGVHFWAPFSWDLTNWGVFWPESTITYVLTALGLLFIVWYGHTSVRNAPGIRWPGIPRLAGIVVLLVGYFLGPLFLLHKPIEANTHFLEVLREEQGRTGRPVEMDRATYVKKGDGHFLEHYGGRVRVGDLQVPAPATVSIKGVFADTHKVQIKKLHVHPRGIRDSFSYIGLALIAAVWGGAVLKRDRAGH